MQKINIILVMVIPFLFLGCSIDETCDEPQPYQESYENNDITVPSGLDELQASKKIVIPKASPRVNSQQKSPCIDSPPSIRTTQ
jgi:hypothetical protein